MTAPRGVPTSLGNHPGLSFQRLSSSPVASSKLGKA